MKLRRYEKVGIIKFLFLFFTGLFLVLLFVCKYNHIKTYCRVDAVVIKEGVVSAFVSDETLAILYRNKYCFIQNKRVNIKIEKVNLTMFRQEKDVYHQVILSFASPSKQVINDALALFFFEKKDSFLSLFFKIWKGD